MRTICCMRRRVVNRLPNGAVKSISPSIKAAICIANSSQRRSDRAGPRRAEKGAEPPDVKGVHFPQQLAGRGVMAGQCPEAEEEFACIALPYVGDQYVEDAEQARFAVQGQPVAEPLIGVFVLVHDVLERGGEQIALGGEEVLNGAEAQPRLLCDASGAEFRPALANEHLLRGLQNPA